MGLSNIGYAFREAFRNFWRNFPTCFGAIITIFLSLFIIGLFAFGSAVVENIFGSVEDKVTIQAFLSDSAPQDKVDALQTQIRTWPNVQNVSYKSKEEALEDYKRTMSNKNAVDALEALDGKNPVPASIIIQLQEPQQVKDTAQKLIADVEFQAVADDPDNVSDSVLYGQGDVEKLFAVANYIRIGGVFLVSLLTFVAFVFINNTIRLAITARKREIAIERLVGASNSFIRGPFLAEGALESLLGAGLAIGALQLVYMYALPALQNSLPFLALGVAPDIVLGTYGLLLGIGLVIGLLGSAIAMGRYLKV